MIQISCSEYESFLSSSNFIKVFLLRQYVIGSFSIITFLSQDIELNALML